MVPIGGFVFKNFETAPYHQQHHHHTINSTTTTTIPSTAPPPPPPYHQQQQQQKYNNILCPCHCAQNINVDHTGTKEEKLSSLSERSHQM
jgi:hypothetical protein